MSKPLLKGKEKWIPQSAIKAREGAYEKDTMRRTAGSDTPMFNRQGEVNATSRKDLAGAQAEYFTKRPNTIRAFVQDELQNNPEYMKVISEYQRSDGMNPIRAQEVTTLVEKYVREFHFREGFTPKILNAVAYERGQNYVIRKNKSRPDIYFSDEGKWQHATWIDGRYYPKAEREKVNITIDGATMDDAPADFLEIIQTEAFEQTALRTDRKTYNFLINDGITSQDFTPDGLATAIQSSLYKTGTILMSAPVTAEFLKTSTNWFEFYSETYKHELMSKGYFGQILDMNLLTESLWEPELRVIGPTEYFLLASPAEIGDYYYDPDFELTPLDLTVVQRDGAGFFGVYREMILIYRAKGIRAYRLP